MQIMARTCSYEKMNLERLFARAFVIVGGVFWVAAMFGASFRYDGQPLGDAAGSAVIPLAIALAALLIGWFYEVLAAIVLLAGAVGVGVWGVVASWEVGMWLLMGAVLMAPMIIAALLFFLAARMQNVCTLEASVTTCHTAAQSA